MTRTEYETTKLVAQLVLRLTYRRTEGCDRRARITANCLLLLMLLFITGILGYMTLKVTLSIGVIEPVMVRFYIGIGLFFAWMFFSIGVFEQKAGGGIDLSRLFHLPVSGSSMVLGSLGARIIAPPMLIPLGVLIAVPLAASLSGHPWRAVIFIPAAMLFSIHVNLLTIAASALSSRVRRSRAAGEWATLAVVMIAVIYVVAAALGFDFQLISDEELFEIIRQHWGTVEPMLMTLPVVSALAWQNAGSLSPLILILALLEAAALLAIARSTLDRLACDVPEASEKKRSQVRARSLGRLALLSKEFRVAYRDPEARFELIIMAAVPLLCGILIASPNHRYGEAILHHAMPLLLPFLLKDRINNHLCRESDALIGILTSPTPRWRVLVEMNLAIMARLLFLMTVPAALLLWHGANPSLILLDVALAVSFLLLMMAPGNIIAVFLPIPMKRKKGQLTATVPLVRQVWTGLAQLVIMAILLPATLPILGVHLLLITIPQTVPVVILAAAAMLAYGVGWYTICLGFAGHLFETSEARLFEQLVQSR